MHLLEELNRREVLEREARTLYAALHDGRWPLTRASCRYYTSEASRWFTPDLGLHASEGDSIALAAGVESLWEEWERLRQEEGRSSGRRTLWVKDRSLLLLWQSTPERLVVLLAGPRYVERQWLAAAQPAADRARVRLALSDIEGHAVLGQLTAAAPQQALRNPAETQLPWTLSVVSADPRADRAQLAARRRLLLAGLGIAAILVLVGTYFISRAMTRELEVAQLQSEFVSAVSHEFRTPLASLLQFSELLADGRVASEERRGAYYQGLRRETERLRRLVEGLLDFSRMEAGAREYQFELVDPGALARNVGEEFAQEVAEKGYRIEIDAAQALPLIRADREALSRALWNLLDNAVKYSPECNTVWMEITCANNQVALRVRDQGLGIAPAEQQQVFKKFFRAASASTASVKGTGLGLAMVRHIVTAHGGQVRVESQPGVGSTFTILLPAVL